MDSILGVHAWAGTDNVLIIHVHLLTRLVALSSLHYLLHYERSASQFTSSQLSRRTGPTRTSINTKLSMTNIRTIDKPTRTSATTLRVCRLQYKRYRYSCAYKLGLPTLDLGIPGLPPLPFPGAPPRKPARGSGERCKLPQWGLGRSPIRQTIWCISEPKGAALVATVFVHFHKNKFKFLYKHKTA